MLATVFDTALGHFGLGWTDSGICRVWLPGPTPDDLRQLQVSRGFAPGEPDGYVARVLDRIEDYAEGAVVDFSDTPLDLAGLPDFHRRAYELLLQVGWGQTLTYGDLARRLGDVGLSRAVGQAMGANPVPLVIPCHRVLASDGKPGGFSAPGGAVSKVRMLTLEGVSLGAPAGQMNFGF
ncbi:methylated-DNA--[protein]-cysteine S-methyltransferase [Devosia sp. CAU 1758]